MFDRQKYIFDRQFDGGTKMFQGLCPKRRESWIANWVYATPNPPPNIVPTNTARLKLSRNFPMNLGIPPI